MRISIRVSDSMNKRSGHLNSLEDRCLRVPMELRELCELGVNDFVNLKSKDGKIVTLKVSQAYIEDAEKDPISAYVTSNTLGALHLRNIEKRHEQEIDIVEDITLGCDPELFLVNRGNNEMLHAGSFFNKFGQLGHDGWLMEIRPLPSTSEMVVTHNIWNLLSKARHLINKRKTNKIDGANVAMIAASSYSGITAGFHLHYGLPKELLGGRRGGKRWNLQNSIARAMDFFVGIPSIIPEGETDSERRTAQHVAYGKPGEWRVEGHTFEYRVPGGNLLRHPSLTMGILGLGAIVMEDAVSRIKMCTNSYTDLSVVKEQKDIQEIYPNIPDIFELYKTICSKSIEPAMKYLDTITKDINQMVGFGKREKSIRQMFKCMYEGTKFSPNIEDSWRLFYNEKQ